LSFKITVVGVIARYSFRNTCIDRKTYSFTNTSIGKLGGILWDFGDNSSTVTTKNTSHTFPSSGKFLTKLTVTDTISGCVDTYSQNIYTADPILVNPDSSICKNATTAFSITNNYTNPASTYTWNVVGTKVGSNKNPALSIKAATLGNFTNFVSINYGSPNCPDTVRLNHLITVKGPDLSFTLPSTSCFNTLFSITNNSKPFLPADSVPLWYWNYGYIAANDSIYQPIPFIYGGTGTFTVKLVGIDINGCKDSLKKTTVVNPIPFLQVVPAIDTLCQGSATILRAFSNNNIAWSPTNNLSCTNCDSVVANPAITTKYYVTATTPANCTSIDSVLVKVFNPITATAQPNPFYICQNESVQLDVNPKGYTINWSPATGLSSTTIYNPTATPLQTNVYTATLTDSVGCFTSSVAISVVIKSLPTVNAGPDQTVSHNASFTLAPSYSANVREYSWTPSNLLSCNVCAIPKGIALNTQTYTIQASSDSGCIATDSVTIFVECKNANILMPKAFTPNNDNLNDVYYPITRGIKTIRKFAIFNREGKLIYEAQNFPPNIKSFGWTGLYKGQIQSSTGYVYILEAICESGEILTKNGSFLLMR
ncbi:MAG: PKD domain-containing protein, partial [Ferruginibacter sp.]